MTDRASIKTFEAQSYVAQFNPDRPQACPARDLAQKVTIQYKEHLTFAEHLLDVFIELFLPCLKGHIWTLTSIQLGKEKAFQRVWIKTKDLAALNLPKPPPAKPFSETDEDLWITITYEYAQEFDNEIMDRYNN